MRAVGGQEGGKGRGILALTPTPAHRPVSHPDGVVVVNVIAVSRCSTRDYFNAVFRLHCSTTKGTREELVKGKVLKWKSLVVFAKRGETD